MSPRPEDQGAQPGMSEYVLSAAYPLSARRPSVNTSVVCDHFGLQPDAEEVVIAKELRVRVQPGEIVLFVGPSGSGKSTLMRCLAAHLEGRGTATCGRVIDCVVDSAEVDLGERALVDELPLRVDAGLELLTTCGLGEARLMLRSAAELSEGQRYRYRLARAVAQAGNGGWVLADEFTATLDRTLARVVAFGVRRLAERQGCGYLLATTHEDIIDDLAPDVTIVCRGEGVVEVRRREAAIPGAVESPANGTSRTRVDRKKKDGRSALSATSNLRPDRGATGRISLGGIIGAGDSASCAT